MSGAGDGVNVRGVPFWVLLLALVAVGAFGALWWTSKSELDDLKAERTAQPDVLSIVSAHIGDEGGFTIDGDETYASVNVVGSGYDDMDKLEAALSELGCPASLAAKIGNTRALDGTLEEKCDRAALSWTYHPDNGLSLVIERLP